MLTLLAGCVEVNAIESNNIIMTITQIQNDGDVEKGAVKSHTKTRTGTAAKATAIPINSTKATIRIPLENANQYWPLRKVQIAESFRRVPRPDIINKLLERLDPVLQKWNKAFRIADAAIGVLVGTVASLIIYLAATGQLSECGQYDPCEYESKHLPTILIGAIGSLVVLLLFGWAFSLMPSKEDIEKLCEDTESISGCKLISDDQNENNKIIEVSF
mmetsp:Transcript_13643/g.22714  ORF Transcript_13643/g.22714 Transcript_13643/m.22714 type:complete len:217 (-) Transcript_13643:590-1240(-)